MPTKLFGRLTFSSPLSASILQLSTLFLHPRDKRDKIRINVVFSTSNTYFLLTALHDLICDLLDVLLNSLRFVLVFEAKCLVFDNLLLLLVDGLGGRTFVLLLSWLGWHSIDNQIYKFLIIKLKSKHAHFHLPHSTAPLSALIATAHIQSSLLYALQFSCFNQVQERQIVTYFP